MNIEYERGKSPQLPFRNELTRSNTNSKTLKLDIGAENLDIEQELAKNPGSVHDVTFLKSLIHQRIMNLG